MATAMIATGTETLVEKKVRKPRVTKKVPVEPVPDIQFVVAEPTVETKKRKRASSGENKTPAKKAKQEEITLESLKEEISQLQFVFAQYTAANDKLILELQALSGKFSGPAQKWCGSLDLVK